MTPQQVDLVSSGLFLGLSVWMLWTLIVDTLRTRRQTREWEKAMTELKATTSMMELALRSAQAVAPDKEAKQ